MISRACGNPVKGKALFRIILLNVQAQITSQTRCLNFGPNNLENLQPVSYFLWA